MTNELTLENIRSGAFPSDAHAVGFLLGELERLAKERASAIDRLAPMGLEIERLRASLTMLIREAENVADDHHRPRYFRLDQALESARKTLDGYSHEPRACGWRPIETAPKGGAWVLLWWPDITDCAIVGYQTPYGWHSAVGGGYESGDKYGHPTHWMPLPESPAEGASRDASSEEYPQCTGEPRGCPYIYCHSQLKCAKAPPEKSGVFAEILSHHPDCSFHSTVAPATPVCDCGAGKPSPCECLVRDKEPSAYHNVKCPRYVADKL